mgnify:CR=1 FL=1
MLKGEFLMDINKEFDKLEMKNFIELTKEAIDQEIKHEKWDDLRKNYSINEVGVKYNTDILDKWNKIRTMYGLYTEGKKGTYMYRPRFPEGKVPLEKLELLSGENRRSIAQILVQLAQVDGVVEPAEVKLLERIYVVLQLEKQLVTH